MHALLDPSRQDIPEYTSYLAAIQRSARAVNDRFGRPGWEPLLVIVSQTTSPRPSRPTSSTTRCS